MAWKDVKDYLQTLDNKQLIAIIGENYKLSKTIKDNLELKALTDDQHKSELENSLFKEYAQSIYEGFFPKRGIELRLNKSQKALQEFSKLNPTPQNLINIKLVYIQAGTDFVETYGDISESFYTSALVLFRDILALVKKYNLFADYDLTLKHLATVAQHRFGYGYGDEMMAIFEEFYPK